MTFSARRRILAGVLVGASLVLAGCTVPGQPAPAGAAAAFENTTISNERIDELSTAWSDEGDQSTSRRSVVTLELLRGPLLELVEELELPYHRSQSAQQAGILLQMQGLEPNPSEELVDAVEGAFVLAIFALDPALREQLREVAEDLESEAATSPRTGDFSADLLMESVDVAHGQANDLYNQGMPTWFIAFRTVSGFTIAGSEWLVTNSVAAQ